jgi:hypothetical protein
MQMEMDAKTIKEMIIKPKLIEIFGNAIGSSLLTKATLAGIKGGTEQEKLELMVETIFSNPFVVGMWGAKQAERLRQEWLNSLV